MGNCCGRGLLKRKTKYDQGSRTSNQQEPAHQIRGQVYGSPSIWVTQQLNLDSIQYRHGLTQQRTPPVISNRQHQQFANSGGVSAATELHLRHLRHPASNAQVTRTPITEENRSTVAEYYRILDRVLRYVKPEHNTSVSIRSIERIVNPALDTRLLNIYNSLHKRDCVPELLIHGTSSSNAENIISNGFRVGTKGMFGAGIYFATDSTKSVRYSRDGGVKTLLLCEVLLGGTMICTCAQNDLNITNVQSVNCDSVFAKRGTKSSQGVLNDEYIVYRPEQVTPRYLVKLITS